MDARYSVKPEPTQEYSVSDAHGEAIAFFEKEEHADIWCAIMNNEMFVVKLKAGKCIEDLHFKEDED